MKFVTVKNWDTFQHYGKRNPPWIKLHRALLDDYAFCALSDIAKAHLMLIWLYASQNNGLVPCDSAFLEKKLSSRTCASAWLGCSPVDALLADRFREDWDRNGAGQRRSSKIAASIPELIADG